MTEPQRVAMAIAYDLLGNWSEYVSDIKSAVTDHTTIEVDEDFINEVVVAIDDLRISI
jgi:hypothetical protein